MVIVLGKLNEYEISWFTDMYELPEIIAAKIDLFRKLTQRAKDSDSSGESQ